MWTILWLTTAALLQGGERAITLDDLRPAGAEFDRTIPHLGYADGPAWSPAGYLLFADRRRDQLLVWQPGETPIELIEPAGQPAGITFDSAGFAYVCQHELRRLVRTSPAGMNEVLAKEYEGKRLNSPENVCLDADGGIWFTDPRYGQMRDLEMGFLMGVYRVDPETGAVARVISDLHRPNGIATSPDGSVLYVGDTDDLTVNAYDVLGPGKLGPKRVLFQGRREDEFGQMMHGGGPDAIAVDELGNLYVCFRNIVVLAPDGREIGTLNVPEWATDACFGGEAGRTLFVAARNSIYTMEMLVGGVPWRAPGKRFEGREAGPVAVDFGWEQLFDGQTLDGWTTRGGHYDGDATWTVEDGVIVGREGPNGEGGLLYTKRAYRNFEFELECRIDWPFDSGIFVRMVPDLKGAQVTLDYRPDGEVGGIYSDGWLKHQPDGAPRFHADSWNRMRVVCVGDDIELLVYLNGEPLTYWRLPPGAEGYAQAGLIGLQVHGATGAPKGNAVRFRNVRIRELDESLPGIKAFDDHGRSVGPDEGHSADEPLTLTRQGHAMGWRKLFDGETLGGWETVGSGPEAYRTGDGVLSFLAGHDGYLRTTADFRDFTLRLDFAIEKMANSGVFLRGDRAGGNPAYSGCEVQILDDYDWEDVTGTQLRPYQFTGGLYGSVPPAVQALLPLGQWNTYEITYRGTRIKTVLNGQVLYDVDTLDVPGDPPFADRAKTGFIGLQQHAPEQVETEEYVRFRDIWILPF